MKAKHTITFIVLGYCLDFIGAFMKMTHKGNADLVFTVAVIFKVVGLLFLLYKITNYPKFKDFLNR